MTLFPVPQYDISPEKANEYMQVSGLLADDVEILHRMAHNPNMTKEDLLESIDLLHENMVDMTTDKEKRESRWGAFVALWGLRGLTPDTGAKDEPEPEPYRFNISGASKEQSQVCDQQESQP